jgi:hypothetical protein
VQKKSKKMKPLHYTSATGNVTSPATSWGLSLLDWEALQVLGLMGKNIRIGLLDTGIHPTAKDLQKQIHDSVEFDKSGKQESIHSVNHSTDHGTQIASLLVGGSRSRMYIGVAPQANLVAATVLEGGLSVVRILKGLNWLGEQGVGIALLCAGLPTTNPVFSPIMRSLRQEGMLVICPIGNAGNGQFFQPGDDPSVLSVGAIDQNGKVPSFSGSRRGKLSTHLLAPDILAPGFRVPCASRTGGRTTSSGTSMAAALVAGVAALLKEAAPEATADQIYDALCYGSLPPQEHQKRHARCGILNASLALEYLQKNKHKTPLPRPERPLRVNKGWRDPRLRYQLLHAAPEDTIKAVYILKEEIKKENWEASVQETLEDMLPTNTTFLPRGRALIVNGPATIHRSLVNHHEITYASAADTGRALAPSKNQAL